MGGQWFTNHARLYVYKAWKNYRAIQTLMVVAAEGNG
jgi:hypothetical protein